VFDSTRGDPGFEAWIERARAAPIERCVALADGARPRLEVLWINPAACAALDRGQLQRTLILETAA
jgi:hypothetical protein